MSLWPRGISNTWKQNNPMCGGSQAGRKHSYFYQRSDSLAANCSLDPDCWPVAELAFRVGTRMGLIPHCQSCESCPCVSNRSDVSGKEENGVYSCYFTGHHCTALKKPNGKGAVPTARLSPEGISQRFSPDRSPRKGPVQWAIGCVMQQVPVALQWLVVLQRA